MLKDEIMLTKLKILLWFIFFILLVKVVDTGAGASVWVASHPGDLFLFYDVFGSAFVFLSSEKKICNDEVIDVISIKCIALPVLFFSSALIAAFFAQNLCLLF